MCDPAALDSLLSTVVVSAGSKLHALMTPSVLETWTARKFVAADAIRVVVKS